MSLKALLKDPKGQSVAVLGAGVSGLAAARLLGQLGASVLLHDAVSLEALKKKADEAGLFGLTLLSESTWPDFDRIAFVVLSPGIWRQSPIVQAALAKSVPIVNEIDLAVHHLPPIRYFGVTGTNGKSTTTAMAHKLLLEHDPHAFAGGNLGEPLCEAVFRTGKPKVAVLELSSYQLETLSQLQLDSALITNLEPDHLDRYTNAEHYYATKERIFDLLKPTGLACLNARDPNCARLSVGTRRRRNFSLDDLKELDVNNPKILGQHNLENLSAALALVSDLHLSKSQIQHAIAAFTPLPHRMEVVGEHNSVLWVNDSKATNVESAIKSVESFKKGVHLILGGRGKGSSYAPLAKAAQGRVKHIYAIGEDAPTIESAFSEYFPVSHSKDLAQAIKDCSARAQSGDTILLAPACASFDQYPNFATRGEHFRQLFKQQS